MKLDKGKLLRRLLRWTGTIPTSHKLLYPFWLSAQLDVVKEERFFTNLPEAMDGLTIGYASDIHYGPLLKHERAAKLVDTLNNLDVDLLLLGGDYGEDTKTAIRFFEETPALSAPMGVYAAIGNHDLMGTPQEAALLLQRMKQQRLTVLQNQAATLLVGDATLCLCAVDDVKRGKPDFEPLIDAAQQADFTLFMPHSPDAMPMIENYPHFAYDLALAGHTHGGQLVLFGRSLHSSSRYGDRFRTGWMDFQGNPLMVSNGVGTSLLPIRMGSRPQVHRITLRKGSPQPK